MTMSAHDSLLSDRGQTDGEGAEKLERRSVIEVELVLAYLAVREKRHLHVAHVIFVLLFAFFDGLDQLEVPCGRLLDSTVEVESVAASCFVVPWLHILKSVRDRFLIVSQEIVEADPEAPWLLREEVRVVLDQCDFLADGQELVRQLFGNNLFEATVVQVEGGSQEIRLQKSDKVLAVERVVA